MLRLLFTQVKVEGGARCKRFPWLPDVEAVKKTVAEAFRLKGPFILYMFDGEDELPLDSAEDWATFSADKDTLMVRLENEEASNSNEEGSEEEDRHWEEHGGSGSRAAGDTLQVAADRFRGSKRPPVEGPPQVSKPKRRVAAVRRAGVEAENGGGPGGRGKSGGSSRPATVVKVEEGDPESGGSSRLATVVRAEGEGDVGSRAAEAEMEEERAESEDAGASGSGPVGRGKGRGRGRHVRRRCRAGKRKGA